MNQLDLMILLTLDHPWEIKRRPHLQADGPGFFTRLRGHLRPAPPASEPTGLAARAASRDGFGMTQDDAARRRAA